jgi:putative intracellular protease/amidase
MKTRSALVIGLLAMSGTALAAASKGKILIVVSSENTLTLKEGKTFSTGYYLNELMVPAMKLKQAGYELVVANPKGNTPTMDAKSDDLSYFGGDQKARDEAKAFQAQFAALQKPLSLAQVLRGGLKQYRGIFVPGGHAPMIDLMASSEFGTILKFFHEKQRPTALICHGPVALAAATKNPQQYQRALEINDGEQARKASVGWAYAGYKMTVFSSAEEGQAEKMLGGTPQFQPEEALRIAGGSVSVGKEWQSNVVQDRELITAQNPFSDGQFVETLLAALEKK